MKRASRLSRIAVKHVNLVDRVHEGRITMPVLVLVRKVA